MQPRMSTTRLVASSLLGVLAAASAVLASLMLVAAWALGSQLSGAARDLGTVSLVTVALLLLAHGAVAGFAMLQEWRGRPIGRLLGLVVAIVAVLGATSALVAGRVDESATLLYVAIGLGLLTAVSLLLPERGPVT